MKNRHHTNSIFILVFLFILSSATKNYGQSIFEFSLGFNTLGPTSDMNKYMIDHHFDVATDNWIWGGTTAHPHYDKLDFSMHALYAYMIKNERWIGMQIEQAYLSEVFGAHSTVGHLFVRFKQFSLCPIYMAKLNKHFDFRLGPCFSINSGKKTSGSAIEPENNFKQFSPGIIAGIDLKLWEREKTFGKIAFHSNLTLPSKLGPFTAHAYNEQNTETIPKYRYSFSHISLKFIYGLKTGTY